MQEEGTETETTREIITNQLRFAKRVKIGFTLTAVASAHSGLFKPGTSDARLGDDPNIRMSSHWAEGF